MHDPMTVAHEIKSPFSKMTPFGTRYRKSLITIWHVDPEKDGTDDSCGWFKRARHGDQLILDKIQKEFLFNYKNNYWFDANGYRHFSTSGIVLNMYRTALWVVYGDHKRVNRFLNKHLAELLLFAENPFDSVGDRIIRKFGNKIDEVQMREFAEIIYSDILRKTQPWHKHPRWHIHHWQIQIHWPAWMRKKKQEQPCCDDNLRATV